MEGLITPPLLFAKRTTSIKGLSMEVFKPINGYKGLYEISNKGNVKSLKRYRQFKHKKQIIPERIKRQRDNGRGYMQIDLNKNNVPKTVYAHRLVATHFIKEIPTGYDINHKDGDKSNNNVENLEIVTRKENIIHAFKTGLSKINRNKPRRTSKSGVINISPKRDNRNNTFYWNICLRINKKRIEKRTTSIYEAMVLYNAHARSEGMKNENILTVTRNLKDRYGNGYCCYLQQ